MKHIIRYALGLFILFTMQIPVQAQDLKKNDPFAQYRLKSLNTQLKLDLFYVLESPASERRKAVGKPIDSPGFQEFSNPYNPGEKDYQEWIYSYKTYFYLDQNLSDARLSLYIGMMNASRIVYLNGVEIYSFGSSESVYNAHPYESTMVHLSRDLLVYADKPNELTIQTLLDYKFESIKDIILGSYEKIATITFFRNLVGLHMVQATLLVSGILALYFLFLFIMSKGKEKKYLYFSLVCLFFAIANTNMSLAYDGISQYHSEWTSRTFYPFTLLFLSFFSMEFTGVLHRNRIMKIIIALPCLCLALLTALQKNLAGIESIFNIDMLFYIAPSLVYNIVIILVSIFKGGNKTSIIMLCGFITVIVCAAHDISCVIQNYLPYTYLVPYGFLSLIICIFFLLADEQSRIYMKSLEQAESLNRKNLAQQGMIDNITSVSENLLSSGSALKDIVTVATDVILDYEKSNRAMTEKVFARFGDMEKTIEQIAYRINVSSAKVPAAVANQTTIVRNVSRTVNVMGQNLESTLDSAAESGNAALKLSELASRSTEIMQRSKQSINLLKDYSLFLGEVLAAIEEISIKTHILSINAAIEAARQGIHGKGFSVIANEIRGLSDQSHKTLAQSFEKIKAMFTVIDESTRLSDQVSESLTTIIDETKKTSLKVENITNLIHHEKEESSSIIGYVDNLLEDTLTIDALIKEEQAENVRFSAILADLQTTFISVYNLLNTQSQKCQELTMHIDRIRNITTENFNNVDILKKSIF